MRNMRRALALVVCLVSIPAVAQTFGKTFPVTNTRYRAGYGQPRLIASDREFFLFWQADQRVRAARLDDGEPRVSAGVADGWGFDAVWTGSHFLVVSLLHENEKDRMIGRLLDAQARPVGPHFDLVQGNYPRLAAGRSSILLLYQKNYRSHAVFLGRDGRRIGPEVEMPPGNTHAVTATDDGFLAAFAVNHGIRVVKFDEEGHQLSERSIDGPSNAWRHLAIASNGTSSLLVWNSDAADIRGSLIEENDELGASFKIANAHRLDQPQVAWNGGGWTVSYVEDANSTTARATVVHLQWQGQTVLSEEKSPSTVSSVSIAALDGREFIAWTPLGQNVSPSVVELPIAQHPERPAPYTPMAQTLVTSASSDDALLTVWRELVEDGYSLHAGVRDAAGNWTEREIARTTGYPSALAASNGREFVVTYSIGNGPWKWLRLDGTGRPIGTPAAPPFAPEAIASNGTNYAILNGPDIALLTPAGEPLKVVSADGWFTTALVSDGSGFLAVTEDRDCPFLLCMTLDVYGFRFGPELQKLDSAPIQISRAQSAPDTVGAGWNGSAYVIGWTDLGEEFHLSFLPPDGPLMSRLASRAIDAESMTVLRDGTIAVAGRDSEWWGDYFGSSRVALFDRTGTLLQMTELERSVDVQTPPRLEALPDGGVAYLASSILDAAPHNGTPRIVSAIAKPAPIAPPDAPHIGVAVQNGSFLVDWTAPAGTVNGYRLEYRIDDDSWNEYEQWFRPGAQHKSIKQPPFGSQFAFRVRAFNDAGASEYSNVTLTKPGRRRAVR